MIRTASQVITNIFPKANHLYGMTKRIVIIKNNDIFTMINWCHPPCTTDTHRWTCFTNHPPSQNIFQQASPLHLPHHDSTISLCLLYLFQTGPRKKCFVVNLLKFTIDMFRQFPSLNYIVSFAKFIHQWQFATININGSPVYRKKSEKSLQNRIWPLKSVCRHFNGQKSVRRFLKIHISPEIG